MNKPTLDKSGQMTSMDSGNSIRCVRCGAKLSMYNDDIFCFACKDKEVKVKHNWMVMIRGGAIKII